MGIFHRKGLDKKQLPVNSFSLFNPVNFNAYTIARQDKSAGMKYIVITAKHHEGFCMWDTEIEYFKNVIGTREYDLPGYTKFT